MLRPGLLDDTVVATAGGAEAVAAACAALGAATPVLQADLLDEAAVTAAAARLGAVGTLVADARPAFAAAGGDLAGLQAALDGTWNAVRATVNAAMRPAGAGKVVLLAPAPAAAPQAAALRAALENLARTTAIEWARHGVRTCALLPGDATGEDDVAALCAWLASPAGDYVTGCAFTLGGA
jgi:NAD(P)-dependent dehydrogenase (short-subunit alcohol dehydrogenase family)